MKKLLIILFLAIGITAYCQDSPFKGFFKPINRALFILPDPTIDRGIRVDESTNFWLFRPVVSITAMQFLFEKPVTVSSLSSFGTGVSFQNIINANAAPYTRFGFNALLLFSQKIGDVEPASLSFAVTGSFLNYVSVGGGYSLQAKKFFILTGVTYNFN